MDIAKVSFHARYSTARITEDNINYITSELIESGYPLKDTYMKRFITDIGNKGYSFSPATFKTSFSDIEMCMRNFEQMQIFILEFSSEISFEEIKEKSEQYCLPILFAYEVLDHQSLVKFRVAFLNDVPIKYYKVAEVMIEALLAIFSEADFNSKEFIRIYSGGRKLLYFDDTIPTINIKLLFRNMRLYWKDQYGDNYRRKVYEFSKCTGIALNDKKHLDVSIVELENTEKYHSIVDADNNSSNESFVPNPILYNIDFGNKVSFSSKLCYQIVMNNSINQQSENKSISVDRKKWHREFRSNDFSKLKNECQLLREFETGNRILTRDELFGIATTVISIDKGEDMFLNSIRKNNYSTDYPKRYSDWQFYLNYLKKTNCIQLPCNIFCPYEQQCHHVGNIVSTKLKYHEVKKQANYNEEFYSIEQVETELKSKFYDLLSTSSSVDKNINILNAQTGIGKSTMVRNHMKEKPKKKYIFAFPTVDLKNKNYEDAIAQGIEAIKTPSLVEYKDKLPAHVWNHIQSLYQTGQYYSVKEYIKEIIAKGEENAECVDILRNHLKGIELFYKFNGNVFTTHSMLLAMDYWTLKKFDAVIIDEDPILNYMIANQVEIPILELEKVLIEVGDDTALGKKINSAIKEAKSNPWITLPTIPYDEAYDSISGAIDIPSFCTASKFYFHKESDNWYDNKVQANSFIFFKPFDLNPRIKYIILSATANHKIYNYIFGSNRVNYYECHRAKYIGTLKQYTYYTVSHAFVDRNPAIVKKMIQLGNTDTIITFKSLKALRDCYFGKTTGIDKYKGKDLIVLGTYHRPEWLYKLFLFTINSVAFDRYKEAKLRHQDTFYNGCGRKFMTYDKAYEMLREIQLWMISSELEQAVGRARLLRYDCTVTVFSNLPLSQANIIDTDYNKSKL